MKEALDEYVRKLEARVRFYQTRAADGKPELYQVSTSVALALAQVVGDFTGEHRQEVFTRIQQERLAQALD